MSRIVIEYNFLTKDWFSSDDIENIKDYWIEHGEEENWDKWEIARRAADYFCYRDNFSIEITEDPDEYMEGSIFERVEEIYWDNLYDSEVDSIYDIVSDFEIPQKITAESLETE